MNVDLIRVLAKQEGLSLTRLEEILGFGNGTIGKWVKQSPSCDKLKAVADYLSVSVDYLLTGEEKNSTTFFSETNNPEYTDHYVAFLDILGFSNYVKDNKTKFDDVTEIYKIYSYIKDMNSRVYQGSAFTAEQMSKLKFNSISDTIVISVPKKEERSLEMLIFAVNVMVFNLLLNCKLFLRGAISEGKFYTDEQTNLLFGPALINAAKLEKNVAIFPRIVILPEVVVEYESNLSDENKGMIKELIKLEQIENDSLYIVNYVKYILERLALPDASKMIKRLDELLVYTEKNLCGISDYHIREKWLYFEQYYNNEIEALKDSIIYHYTSRKIDVDNYLYNQNKSVPELSIQSLPSFDQSDIDNNVSTNTSSLSNRKSSPSELSEEEQECIDKFNRLTDIDKGKIIERMDVMYSSYTPEVKENA